MVTLPSMRVQVRCGGQVVDGVLCGHRCCTRASLPPFAPRVALERDAITLESAPAAAGNPLRWMDGWENHNPHGDAVE